MKELFWKLAGADCSILRNSGGESQRSFYLIGMLYSLVTLLMFIAMFGLFLCIFENLFIACSCSVIFTFLFSNIYRLNMMSLEPATLRDQATLSGNAASYGFRFFIISFFAFFITKCLETVLFLLIDGDLFNHKEDERPFLKELLALNQHYPVVWIFSALMILLFLLPVILKFQLNKSHEYYSLKRTRDIRLVVHHNNEFYPLLEELQKKNYGYYVKDGVNPEPPVYTKHEQRFTDAPFNTKKKAAAAERKSNEEFLDLFQ